MKKGEQVKVTKLIKANKTNRLTDHVKKLGNDNIKDYDRAWEDDRL